MAHLEIRDPARGRSVVELDDRPLAIGFDEAGSPAWGERAVAGVVGEVWGDRLRHGGAERRLRAGERVSFEGIEIVYRPDDAQVDADRAQVLREVGRALASDDGTEARLDRVLDAIARALPLRRAAIAVLDDDARLVVRAHRGDLPALEQTLRRAAASLDHAFLLVETSRGEHPGRLAACAPLRHEGAAHGVLVVERDGAEEPFGGPELDFLSAVAHLVAFELSRAVQAERLREENAHLRGRLGLDHEAPLIASSAAMVEVARRIAKVAAFDATVLLEGESGVGKERVAREIHRRSPRAAGPFVALNCAAIPETLLESELFGYAPRSGIAGADPDGRIGRIEQAAGGTLLLDEIGEMRPELQAKLLRVMQDKVVDRLGDRTPRKVDVRVVCATNQPLGQRVKEGSFREDLYYRLRVVSIVVPPLRERRTEIPALTERFVRAFPGIDPARPPEPSRSALRALLAHDWPGNVRELENAVQQALILGDGRTIRLADLPEPVRAAGRRGPVGPDGPRPEELPSLAQMEAEHIARVLRATRGNKARTARILGISKPTLYDKIRRYGLGS